MEMPTCSAYQYVNLLSPNGVSTRLRAYCDWTSEDSYIHPNVVDCVDPEEWVNIQPCDEDSMISRESGDCFPVYGKLYITLDYNQRILAREFLLADMDGAIILGKDILKNHN